MRWPRSPEAKKASRGIPSLTRPFALGCSLRLVQKPAPYPTQAFGVAAAIREVEYRYPTQAELAAAGPDNIARLTAHMVDAGHVAEAEVEELRKEVNAVVEDAVQFALQSAQPTMDAAWAHLNCNRRHEVLI